MHPSAGRIVELYDCHAQAWDRQRRDNGMERPWLDRFTALLPRGGSVIDIGCGSGQPIARHLLRLGFEVTGIDASAAMIGLCRARFPERTSLCGSGSWPSASWHVADMRTLALGRRFDGLVAWNSFFHLAPDDQRHMFAMFSDHARPGAALLMTTGPAHGEAIGAWQGEPLYHASLAPAEYIALCDAHGFAVLAHAIEDPACGGQTVWLARRTGARQQGAGSAPP